MTPQFDAVIAGNICLDIIPSFNPDSRNQLATLFAPGHLTTVGKAQFSSGGCVANTGIALHKLGIRTKFMGKIGDDFFGGVLTNILAASCEELLSGMVTDSTSDTSYTVILNPPGIDRIFFHNPGANDTFSVNDVDLNLISQAKLFHFGYPPLMKRMFIDDGKELIRLFSSVRKLGVTTSLDMSLPDPSSDSGKVNWKTVLRSLLPHVDIFLPSIDEILFMLMPEKFTGSPGIISADLLSLLSKQIIEMGAKIVGIKLGNQGFYIRTSPSLDSLGRASPSNLTEWTDKEFHVPCFKVDVAGTTGAGDTTIAGFLAALLKGLSIEECATMAVAVGACCVEAPDATSGILGWEETRKRIDKGWAGMKND
jgi:sugar/nucleoside kinase (ribokinase family)